MEVLVYILNLLGVLEKDGCKGILKVGVVIFNGFFEDRDVIKFVV